MKKIHSLLTALVFTVSIFASPAWALDYMVGFSPKGSSQEIILDAIEEAQEEILVAAYSFTSKPISEALVKAHKKGIKVMVVADHKGNQSKYTAVTYVANQGVPTRLNSKYAIMHHKYMVIDKKHLQVGSFNYSAAAFNKNAENVLYLRNVPQVAHPYINEWKRLWDEGVSVEKRY